MALGDLFVSRSSRTFHVDDDVGRANRVVAGMRVDDAARRGLPPGVLAARTAPGRFDAVTPAAMFDSRFETESDGAGGAWVTEHETAFSPFPGVAYLAGAIHDAVTDPEEAYGLADSRD